MGDENRWQIELLQRFGVYTFFREIGKGSELTLGNDGVLALLYVSVVWNFSVSIECLEFFVQTMHKLPPSFPT